MRIATAACLLALGAASTSAFAATPCNGVSNNLVSNCGFETGDFSNWSGSTLSDPHSGVDSGDPLATQPTPYEGTYEAYLGTIGATSVLSQTLATVAGQQYNIEFALLNDTSQLDPYTNSFLASFAGTTLLSQSNVAADGYMLYSFDAVANSAASVLSFTNRNDQGDFELDSISVTPVAASSVTPEPSSFLLLGTGLMGALGVARRRFQA